MIEIVFAIAVGLGIGLPILRFSMGPKLGARSVFAGASVALGVGAMAILNFELGIFDQKVASTYAFDVFQGRGGASTAGFGVQAVMNAIPFAALGAWWAAIGTNVALLALAYVYVRRYDARTSHLLLAPAVVNFAMFALRDMIIAVGFLILTIELSKPRAVRTPSSSAREYIAVAVLYLSRPETIAIYAGFRALEARHAIRRSPWLLALAPVGLAICFVALTRVPSLVGLDATEDITSIPGEYDSFFEQRTERNALGEGGDTNILGGRLTSIPFVARFPIQLLAFFITPLPFEITSVFLLLAFVDSVVFVYFTRQFWAAAPTPAKTLLVMYVLSVALFIANYGNLLRLRMPAYMILAGGLLVARSLNKQRVQTDDALQAT